MKACQSIASNPDLVAYPAEVAQRYRAAGLWGTRTIAQEFRSSADRFGDRPALISVSERLTYTELDQRSDAIASGLHAAGLVAGERVLLQMTNTPWAVVAWYGLLKAGLVPIASLAQHGAHEIGELARQAAPAAHLVQCDFPRADLLALAREVAEQQPSLRRILTLGAPVGVRDAISLEKTVADPVCSAGEARAVVARIQSDIDPDDLAVLQLSGGTTSVPKLIPRLHAEYWYNSRAWAAAAAIDSTSVVLHLLPVIHNAGIVCAVHAAHSAGGAVAVGAATADTIDALADACTITHMLMTRPIAALISADSDLRETMRRDLRVVHWADKALPETVAEEFESPSCRVGQMFGMGEGLCMATPLDAPADIRHSTNGAPLSALDEVRVLHPGTEEDVAPGEAGELCVRGPYSIRGYYRAPERNLEAFTSSGFYRTGDIVREIRVDGRSFYRLEDRIKDLINRGGEKINAQEVEELLGRHPAIERAAVVAMPDGRLGERSCAFVVPRAGQTPPSLRDVQRFFGELGVAKFKWPERIEVRSALPLTNIDKVHKVMLRKEIAALLAGEAGSRQPRPNDATGDLDSERPLFCSKFRVSMGDTDAAGIIYFAAPARWTERLIGDWLAESGIPTSSMLSSGFGLPAVHVELSYHCPLRLDDVVQGTLRLHAKSQHSVTWRAEFALSTDESPACPAVVVSIKQVHTRLDGPEPVPVELPVTIAQLPDPAVSGVPSTPEKVSL